MKGQYQFANGNSASDWFCEMLFCVISAFISASVGAVREEVHEEVHEGN